jgi:hypothetical protein
MLSMQQQDHVDLYQLEDDCQKEVKKSSSRLVGTVRIKTKSNLVASRLSPNGKWLAVCNAASLFVFGLQVVVSNDSVVEPQKVTLPKEMERLSVVAIHFNGDTLFVADSSGGIYSLDLSDESMTFSKILIPNEQQDRLPIHAIHTSKTGTFLVTVSRQEEDGIHIFRKTGASASAPSYYQHYWTIPGLAGARPAALTLIEDDQVAVATFTSQVYLFDLAAKKLSPWSEQHEFPIKNWPFDLSCRKDFPIRLLVNPSNRDQLVMVRLVP